MFDSVLFTNKLDIGCPIDVGSLAEALIFYRRVLVVTDTGTVRFLLSKIPPLVLTELLDDRRLELHVIDSIPAVAAFDGSGARTRYGLTKIVFQTGVQRQRLRDSFLSGTGNGWAAKRAAKKFDELVKPFYLENFDQNCLLNDLAQDTSLTSKVSAILADVIPADSLPSNLQFSVHAESSGVYVQTNVDFNHLNQIITSPHSRELNVAYVLSRMQRAHELGYYAANFTAEMHVDEVELAINSVALENAQATRIRSQQQLDSFVELTLTDSRAIREAVNEGRVSLRQVHQLARKADKFRSWLSRIENDESILREYLAATARETWAEKLPYKAVKFAVFCGGGLALESIVPGGGAKFVGPAVGAFEALAVDQLVRGWKPHFYVENRLKPAFKVT